ncbi:hypothetical protein [Haloarcula pellucida]|uniref:Uncharacterized protein n=1 Tax=Haloarcula pellucida TaxID=1427151 RepID=A0A830GM67_9EURY|nr:hypothetical protein [Halomicroarcula pellucida]MBX0348063.1 hypothetical protein [Halomicroarcula pellucida]GGN96735.1 hypothetical protein GCM10009030_25360 [Halomicroarcula pellucida]
MTRITFQFVPSSFIHTDEIILKNQYTDSACVDSNNLGVTTIELQDGRLDKVASGSIRYSVDDKALSEDTIERVYDEAIQTLNEVLAEGGHDYRVSLIIGDMDSYEQYYRNRGSILKFGSNVLESEDPEYTELDEFSVKISFAADGRQVSV